MAVPYTSQSPYYDVGQLYQGWGQPNIVNAPFQGRELEDYLRNQQGLPALASEEAMMSLLPSRGINPRLAQRLQGAGYNPAAAASLAGRMNTSNLVSRIRSAQDIINMIEALRQKYTMKRDEYPSTPAQEAGAMEYFQALS